MFQEQDQGKPKRWGSLILIIVLVVSLCLAIVVVCRILLDSEDEINEPIIQGELREKMNMFLGIFTMTFFFGFCCCFCCGCICCRARGGRGHGRCGTRNHHHQPSAPRFRPPSI